MIYNHIVTWTAFAILAMFWYSGIGSTDVQKFDLWKLDHYLKAIKWHQLHTILIYSIVSAKKHSAISAILGRLKKALTDNEKEKYQYNHVINMVWNFKHITLHFKQLMTFLTRDGLKRWKDSCCWYRATQSAQFGLQQQQI